MSRVVHAEGFDRLEHVRATALELFSEIGYHAVSLRCLASRVGLAPGHFIHI